MRNVLVIYIFYFFSCCNRHSNSNTIEKMFSEHKTDWQIANIDYKWKNFDYYSQPLYDCVIRINSKSIKKANSYMIKFANGKDVIIEILEFHDLEFAKKVYEKTEQYAKKIRTTSRKNAGQLCEPIKDWDFHYVFLDNCKLYLIGCINGNFVFKDGDMSLESDKTFLYETQKVYEFIKSDVK